MFRRILLFTIAAVLFVIAIVFILPLALPAQTIKTQIENLIEQNTGWRIRLSGDVSMSLFPSVRLVAADIQMSPPDHDPILKADKARFAVGLSALFSGAVDIEEIYFGNLNVNVELDQNGNPVWLASAPSNGEEQTTQSQSASAEPNSADGIINALVESLRVQRVAVEDATIQFGKSGETPTKIDTLNLTASLPDPAGSLFLTGSAILNDDPVKLSGEIKAFKSLLSDNKGAMALEAGYKNAVLKVAGDIDTAGEILLDSTINLDVSDLSQLAGNETIASGSLSANGKLVATKDAINLKLDESRLFDTLFFSDLTLETGGAKPKLSGTLDFGAIDLNKIKPQQEAKQSPSGQTQNNASTAAPDLSGLRAIDVDLAFASGSISVDEHTLRDLSGVFLLDDGVVDIKINEVVAVGGSASASVITDTKAQPLTTYGSVKADRLSATTILALAGQNELMKQIDGLIGADLVFGFQGLETNDIVATANARGTISFYDASVSGLGLASAFNDASADRADKISLTATIDGFSKPVRVNGKANWRAETIKLDATSDPAALIAGRQAPTRANVSFSKANATFSGNVSPALPTSGTIAVNGPSLRALAKWLGTDLPSGPGYGAFNVKTSFNATPQKVDLSDLSANLDDIKGTGNATVLLAGKPDITANVAFDLLDVNPYIATPAGGNTNQTGQSGSRSSQWSQEAIDFSFLDAVNLALSAKVNSLKAQGLNVGPLALKTTIRNGKLTANLSEMGFYGGRAVADVTLNAADQTPTLSARLTSNNVQALPFLRDAAKFERIEGSLNLGLNLQSAGRSEAALVSALNGTANFAFNDGAIRGINIAQSMRALTSGALNGWNNTQAEKTDFSAFTASFNIKNGLAANNDLNLVGPLVRVSGRGTANMPQQTLKYRVNPKIVASLEGQGGKGDLAGFAVPIIVDGPWAKPRIYPDIEGFLQNPAAGLETLKSLGGGFAKIASGKPGDLVKSLGNDPKGAAVAKVGDLVSKKTGVDLGTLVKDGKIDKKQGVAAAVGAVTTILGGGQAASSDQAAPLQQGDLPYPRPRPRTARANADPVANIIKQVVTPNAPSDGTDNQPAFPVKVPKDAKKLIKGIGGLLGNYRNSFQRPYGLSTLK